VELASHLREREREREREVEGVMVVVARKEMRKRRSI
jgi:hypothetical protein